MKIFRDFSDIRPGSMPASTVTIGNFDGCHVGHQSLVKATVGHAKRLGAPSIALTFSPRPDAYFKNLTQENLLFTEEQKSQAFTELGIDIEILKRFDRALSQLSAEEFYDRILIQTLHAQAIIIGDNFRFGQGRLGSAQFLAEKSAQLGTTVEVGHAIQVEGSRVSSTRIRESLMAGDVALATSLLGRPYLLEGKIQRGDQLGRTLGVPTANLEGVNQIVPKYGIYAGFVWLEDDENSRPTVLTLPKRVVPAVFSIGIRPTLEQGNQNKPPLRLEAHLLQGTYGLNALYGLRAGFYLTHWLRGEVRFASLEALKRQMALDIDQARAILAHTM